MKEKKYVLGADFGTTSLKAAVFDTEGNMVSSVTLKYELITNGSYVEFEAEKYFELFMSAYEKLSAEYEISALSVDTQGETLIVCDSQGNSLRNAIVWLDSRAVNQAAAIEAKFGIEKVYSVTGQPEISSLLPASKLLWIKENEPEIFAKTKMIFLLEDYIIWRLTGVFATDRTLQSSTLYLDIRNGEYFGEMLDFIGVGKDMLPELHESGDFIGTYKGIPVAASALDQIAALTGSGALNKKVITEMTGTSMAVMALSDKIPPYKEGLKVPCYYVAKGKYCLLMWSSTSGMTLKWYRDTFCPDLSFAEIDKLCEKIPAGSEGLVCSPNLCGSTMPKYNPGLRAAFYGVELFHTRAHFARSIMEAVACMLKEFVDMIPSDSEEIRSLGGGASSELWLQIKADITGKTIKSLKCKEPACLGSAIFALKALGTIDSIEAFEDVKTEKIFTPQKDASFVFERYKHVDDLINLP